MYRYDVPTFRDMVVLSQIPQDILLSPLDDKKGE
nr:MAG TPA: TIR-domain containing protein [Caudoviricetes sp.]